MKATDWTVEITGKARKQRDKLPEEIADALLALWKELRLEGPVQPEWPHYGKLKGRKAEEHHRCRLEGSGQTNTAYGDKLCWHS